MTKRVLLFLLLGWFQLSAIAQLDGVEIDTTAMTDSISVIEPSEDEEENEGEEATTTETNTVDFTEYEKLMAKATDTIYSKGQVASVSHFASEDWKSLSEAYDFTEHPPEKNFEEIHQEDNSKLPDWDLGWLAGLLKYGSLLFLIGAMSFIIFKVFNEIWVEKEFGKEELLSWETNPDAMSFEKLEALLADFLSQENYKQALRIIFLMVLKRLNAREIIRWKKNKTNAHYLREIKDQELRTPYRRLSHAFDAARYGNYQVSKLAFERLRGEFDQIQNHLNPEVKP